jgi:hypothetical protein
MTGKRVTARRRERVERLTDRERSAFLRTRYWQDETGPGYDPDLSRDDAIAERDAWDEEVPVSEYDGKEW